MLPDDIADLLYRFLLGVDSFVASDVTVSSPSVEAGLTKTLLTRMRGEDDNPHSPFSAKYFKEVVDGFKQSFEHKVRDRNDTYIQLRSDSNL